MKTKPTRAGIYGALIEPSCGKQRPLFSLATRFWNPPTDIFESCDRAVIRMEVAGLQPDSIKLEAQGRRLHVSGRRIEPRENDLLCYHQSEIQYGAFERIFEFPFALMIQEIKATYDQGFLTIEVPCRNSKTAVSISVLSESKQL